MTLSGFPSARSLLILAARTVVIRLPGGARLQMGKVG
jgi:hypothetical protein